MERLNGGICRGNCERSREVLNSCLRVKIWQGSFPEMMVTCVHNGHASISLKPAENLTLPGGPFIEKSVNTSTHQNCSSSGAGTGFDIDGIANGPFSKRFTYCPSTTGGQNWKFIMHRNLYDDELRFIPAGRAVP